MAQMMARAIRIEESKKMPDSAHSFSLGMTVE
jgi:hypothetical protein